MAKKYLVHFFKNKKRWKKGGKFLVIQSDTNNYFAIVSNEIRTQHLEITYNAKLLPLS
jgi:hypothetical protein